MAREGVVGGRGGCWLSYSTMYCGVKLKFVDVAYGEHRDWVEDNADVDALIHLHVQLQLQLPLQFNRLPLFITSLVLPSLTFFHLTKKGHILRTHHT